jgi:hypothetical protein
MLKSIRFLPSFCGRWEVEHYPNWQNLVFATVPPDTAIQSTCFDALTGAAVASRELIPEWKGLVTAGFTQIGEPFLTVGWLDIGPYKIVTGENVGITVYPIVNGFNPMQMTVTGLLLTCRISYIWLSFLPIPQLSVSTPFLLQYTAGALRRSLLCCAWSSFVTF